VFLFFTKLKNKYFEFIIDEFLFYTIFYFIYEINYFSGIL